MIAAKNLLKLTLLVSLGTHSGALAAGSKQEAVSANTDNYPPERALPAAKTDLENLMRKVKGGREIWNEQSLEPKKIAAADAFARAKNFYEAGEYLSVAREINAFQDLSQYHETKTFLDAMYYLGNSYDVLGFESQAIKAYLRYIAAFTNATETDYTELIDVMTSLMAIAGKQTQLAQAETMKIIAAVANMNLPPEFRPEVSYLASRTARDSGRRDLALEWLERSSLDQLSGNVGAKTAYFRGVLLLQTKADEDAESALLRAKELSSEDASISDLATLALARLEARRHNYPKALRYYQSISASRPAYRHALYETIFTALRNKQDELAEKSVSIFLSKYQEGADTLQIKTVQAYIMMRAGKKGEASERLAQTDKTLNQLIDDIRKSMRGKLRVTHRELLALFNATEMILRQSPIAEDGLKLFEKLAELDRRTSDAEGDLRSLVYSMGRASFAELQPRFNSRNDQLRVHVEELLTIGHKMISSERQALESVLTPAQYARLDASERRRTKLLDPGPTAVRDSQDWALLSDSIRAQSQLVAVYASLGKSQAELNAARYINAKTAKTKGQDDDPAASLKKEQARLDAAIRDSLTRLRSTTTQTLIARGPHQALKRLLTQYASALYQEESILSLAREKGEAGYQYLDRQDAKQAWALWRTAAKEIYMSLSDLSSAIAFSVNRTTNDQSKLFQRSMELKEQVANVSRRLELAIGQAISSLLEHYESEFLARTSQNQKLRADLEWSRFQDITNEESSKNAEYDKKNQEYKDMLQDLKQGTGAP